MPTPEKMPQNSEKTPEQLATRDLLEAQKHDIEQKKLNAPARRAAEAPVETARTLEQQQEAKKREIAERAQRERQEFARVAGLKLEEVPTLEEQIREEAMTLRRMDTAQELKTISEKWWLDRDHPVFRFSRKLFDLVLDPIKAALKYPFRSFLEDKERAKLVASLDAHHRKVLENTYQLHEADFAEYEKAAKDQWAKLRGYEHWEEYSAGISLDAIRRKNKRNMSAVTLTEDLDEYDVVNSLLKKEKREFETRLKEVFNGLSAKKS